MKIVFSAAVASFAMSFALDIMCVCAVLPMGMAVLMVITSVFLRFWGAGQGNSVDFCQHALLFPQVVHGNVRWSLH